MTPALEPQVKFDAHKFAHSPQTIVGFVKQLTTEPAVERREAPRYSVTLPATAVALDERLRPIGPQFSVVVRNISARGIALLHSSPVHAEHIAVELATPAGHKIQVAMEVSRCHQLGPCYEIAGPFVHRPAN